MQQNKVLAAVSGGPDSMSMLHMYSKDISVVCFVNYKKREQADEEQKTVQEFCEKNNIIFESLIVKKEEYENKENFQNLARKIRYDFFLDIAKKHKLKTVFIAHHLDDFVETAVYQEKRNSKTLYLGMKQDSNWKELKIHRPLLFKFRKSQLEEYCQKNNIKYWKDLSNDSAVYSRNRIRAEIKDWTDQEFQDKLKEVLEFNERNSDREKKITSWFEFWEKDGFSLSVFKTFEENDKFYLIYKFLRFNGEERINKNKIQSILQFINARKTNHYRLEDNKSIVIIEKKIVYSKGE